MTHCCTDCYVTQWKARKIHKIIRVNLEFIMTVLLASPTKFLSFVSDKKSYISMAALIKKHCFSDPVYIIVTTTNRGLPQIP